MKRNKKIPVSTLILFLVALALLGVTAVGGARAVLSIISPEYDATMDTKEIGIAIVDEDGNVISGSGSIEIPHEADGKVKIGKDYELPLSVKNKFVSSEEEAIDEYVRVTVYKYWVKKDGSKDTSLDPALITLGVNTNDWIEQKSLTTDERTVLYYKKILKPEEISTPFLNSITLNKDISIMISQSVSEKVIDGKTYQVTTTKYSFDGKSYMIDVQADAVQTHNAVDAIRSAWGGVVSIDGSGNITSVN